MNARCRELLDVFLPRAGRMQSWSSSPVTSPSLPIVETEYLDACVDVVQAAREAPGCLDFALSADLLQPDRINVFECWQDVASVEAFQGQRPRR